ncbi:MAG TPA: hypothetical protein VGG37_07420 [Opitutaceae bacterium]
MKGGDRQVLTRAQVRFYVAGIAVLVLGTLASVWAYRSAVVDDMADELEADALQGRNAQGQLEYIGGKSNVLAADIQEWFVGLWHGRHLAYTLAVLSIAGALLCFYIAFALPDLPPADGAADEK